MIILKIDNTRFKDKVKIIKRIFIITLFRGDRNGR